jgi:hypothetical protein
MEQGARMVMMASALESEGEVGPAPTDYARAVHADDWLHHPVVGDPSWDAFEREPGNPIHVGRQPYLWPVNGFLFLDPVTTRWYAYVSVYPRGYWPPPPADSLILREKPGGGWEECGYVFGKVRPSFAVKGGRMGAATDVSVVYADGQYHAVYGWCDPDNRRGGLAYACAASPEGPFTSAETPIHDDGARPVVMGRYVRAYASTLIRRRRDWLILHMMSTPGNAGGTWGLFAMVSRRPDSAYGDPVPLLAPQLDGYHPPLAEFFPAFVRGGRVYAPATSVAANRTFQSLFSAPLEAAHRAEAWRLDREGSLWHADAAPWEAQGIWGQTLACAVTKDDFLRAMYPAKDRRDIGAVGVARRPWKRPLRDGFVVSSPNGLAYAALRPRYTEFDLSARIRATGAWRLCWACREPLGPDHPYADSRPHAAMARNRCELRLGGNNWTLARLSETGEAIGIAQGAGIQVASPLTLQVTQRHDRAEVRIGETCLWSGVLPAVEGRIELVGEPGSLLTVEHFSVAGRSIGVAEDWLATEALAGSAAPTGEWTERRSDLFRFGVGYETSVAGGRAKWNITGERLTLWAPRDPRYGEADVVLDGRPMGRLSFHSAQPAASAPVASYKVPPGRHALVVLARSGIVPCDSLSVSSGA